MQENIPGKHVRESDWVTESRLVLLLTPEWLNAR